MKKLSSFAPCPRPFRRFILTTAILPAALASVAFGANWSGPVSLDTGSAPEDIHVLASSTVTLVNTGAGFSITEPNIFFQPTVALETLTVNGAGFTLRSVNTILANANGRAITINGDADFAPGALFTGPAVGVPTVNTVSLIKNGGAGILLLDDVTNTSNLTNSTLKVLNGTLSIVGDGVNNPVSSLTTRIEIGDTPNGLSPVLRIGSSGASGTTFLNNFNAKNTGTIEHLSATNDTFSNASGNHGITDNKILTVNVAAGALTIDGTIGDLTAPATTGGSLRKTGVGTTLTLPGTAFVSNLSVVEGKVDVTGRLRTTSAPTLASGTTLTLRNQSTSLPNTLPATIAVPTGATLEGVPGAFSVSATTSSTLNLTGGTLNLGIGTPVPGLTAHLYTGNDAGANLAFGAPDFPANTITNFLNYFNLRGPGLVTSTGANGVADLNFGGGDVAMYANIAPTFTATNNIVSRFNGKIVITAGGLYNFGTTSDDGSMVYIDGATVVANNRYQGAFRRSGTVCLSPGVHDIEIGFYEGGGANSISVDYSGPDTGNAQTIVPNTVLIPGDSLAFLNPITVTANSVINTSSASVASTTFPTNGKALNVNGYGLDLGAVTLAGGAGTYTVNVSTQNAEVIARSIADSGAAVSVVNNGAGMLVLESGAAAQLANGVAVTSNVLGVVLGGAGGSPTGAATVNVNGGSLTLSSKGGDQTYTPVGLSFTNGGSIAAGQIGTGVSGTVATPIRATLSGALTVNNGNTLALTSYDNYILQVAGISGGGSVNIICGTVAASGAVSLTGTGQLNIANASAFTQAGASAAAITVSDSTLTNTGTLVSASTLTLLRSTLASSGNVSATGAVSVTDSTITGTGTLGAGSTANFLRANVTRSGGISATGAVTVANSTITSGGLASGSTIDVTNSTVTSTGPIVAPGGLTGTASTVTANGGTVATIAITDGKFINTGALATGPGGITIDGGTLTTSTLELRGGSISGGPIAAQGAILHVVSGVTVASTSANFTGSNPTGLRGRFILTGGHGQISRGDTQSGILTIETGTNGLAEKILIQPLNFPQDADNAIEQFFGQGIDTENGASGFAMGFFGNFKAPTTGPYTFATGLNDDDAGFWVDLDGDGVFEGGNVGGTPGANGNELIAWASCCGDGANQHPGTVTLTQGISYKVGIAVEDGQGGSGLVGRITAPGDTLKIVDPSAVDQADWWSYGQPNQVLVDAGAELDIKAITGSVDLLVNGRLQFDGPGSSVFDSLTIGAGGFVEVGSGPPAPGGLGESALPVPEPGALGLALLGALGLLGRRRHARRD